MKKPHLPAIREVLRMHPSGMTTNDIHRRLPNIGRATTVKSALRKMPDAYVDRWTMGTGTRGQYEAVWCVIVPPPHCPHPTERFVYKPQTKWAEVASKTGALKK